MKRQNRKWEVMERKDSVMKEEPQDRRLLKAVKGDDTRDCLLRLASARREQPEVCSARQRT